MVYRPRRRLSLPRRRQRRLRKHTHFSAGTTPSAKPVVVIITHEPKLGTQPPFAAWSKARRAPSRHGRDARVYNMIIGLRPCMTRVRPLGRSCSLMCCVFSFYRALGVKLCFCASSPSVCLPGCLPLCGLAVTRSVAVSVCVSSPLCSHVCLLYLCLRDLSLCANTAVSRSLSPIPRPSRLIWYSLCFRYRASGARAGRKTWTMTS